MSASFADAVSRRLHASLTKELYQEFVPHMVKGGGSFPISSFYFNRT